MSLQRVIAISGGLAVAVAVYGIYASQQSSQEKKAEVVQDSPIPYTLMDGNATRKEVK